MSRRPLGKTLVPSIGLSSLVAFMACSPYPAPETLGAGSVGCYALTWGTWSDSIAPTWLRPGPSTIQLHTTRVMTPGWVLISTIDTLKGSWRRRGADSLFLDWSDGSSGVSVALGRSDAELVGLAKLWSGEVQGIASWPTDSVRAHREPCR